MNAEDFVNAEAEAVQPLHLPLEGLHPDIQYIIKELAETYQCSQDMLIAVALGIIGVASGKKVKVWDGKHTNYLILFIAAIARSGSGKSQALKMLLLPLVQKNREQYKKYKDALEEWKATPNNPQPKPKWNQVILSDCTPEARNQALADAVDGLVSVHDELRTFFEYIERYANGDITLILSMFDADDISINRKSGDNILIESPFMSIIGGIQPSILASTFGNKLMMGNGFNQRWLFTYQEDTKDAPYTEKAMDDKLLQRWCEIVDNVLNADTRTLYISGEAKRVYIQYFNDCQIRMNDMNDYMRAVLAKLEIIVERLSGCIHILNGEHSNEISASTMRYAVSMMPYFERTASKVYENLCDSGQHKLTKKELIKQIFANWDCTQSGLAKVLGCSSQYINKILNPK